MIQGLNYRSYSELLNLASDSIKKIERNYNLNIIEEAYELARYAHRKQKRISGVPYIFHPVSVAYILVELGMDNETVVAAILHDVLEDTDITKEKIKLLFGQEVCDLVDGVTKLRFNSSKTQEEQQAENIKKILFAMSNDIRVIMIKLADRLQNMRTIDCMPAQKRRNKALQNMEIFAPIAHKLGIRTIKDELEDISVKCLDPIACDEIENSLALSKQDRDKFIDLIKTRIKEKIGYKFPEAHIEGRVKSLNEIYKKMFIKNKNLDQIYDVYAIRIIVNEISECYNIFGLIHDVFQPIPNKFKDYIATPKSNMYQSLHTTVLSSEGIPFEVQIRTWSMHETAEYGIAAHWKYKHGRWNEISKSSYDWINQVLDNYQNIGDVTEVVSTIKSDLAPKEIFVLTPKGRVVNLPINSTVIDFAYAVHTELGNKMIGAKVNKKIVPINHTVKTGEIVEIISTKNPNKGPSRDWLNIAKTGEARSKIKQWLKKECREENIREGKNKFEAELIKYNISVPKDKFNKFLEPILRKKKYLTPDDFFAEVGFSGIQLSKIMPKLYKEYIILNNNSNLNNNIINKNKICNKTKYDGVIVEGMNDCSIKFAKCCNPLPHDDIIGFITRGAGVSVHKKNCKNIEHNLNKKDFVQKLVKAQWDSNINMVFEASLTILATYDEFFLGIFTKKISDLKISLISLNSEVLPNNKILSHIKLHIKNPEELKNIKQAISEIKNVISIKRE